MKVYISKYRYHWISPYTMIDYMFFWTDWSKCSRNKHAIIDDKDWVKHPEWVDKLADKLEPISVFLQKFLDFIHPRIEYVKIDYWDVWGMDHTLAQIIVPMLKQLKKQKQGYPLVADEDVPEHLRSTNAAPKENKYDWDEFAEARWEWVLDEMIQAFECDMDDTWEDKYYSGNIDFKFVPDENNPNYSKMVDGPNHSWRVDEEGLKAHSDRNDNGRRLFAKYYKALWD